MVKEALERAAIANPNSPVSRVIKGDGFENWQKLMTGVVAEITTESFRDRSHVAEAEREETGRELAATLKEIIIEKGEDLLVDAREHSDSVIGQELRNLENPLTPQEQKFIKAGKEALMSYGRNRKISKPVETSWKALVSQLQNCSDSEKDKLMQRLAEGLGISESGTHLFFRDIVDNQRRLSGRLPNRDPAFTVPAQVFVVLVGKMSGFTQKTHGLYIDYLNTQAGLRGIVTVDQAYLPITNWICQNQGQNPK